VEVEEEAPDRDSEVAGRAGALEVQEAERARVGAAVRVRAEVYGKRGRPRVEAEGPVVEGGQVRAAELARVEGSAAAELDRGVEGQVVVGDLAGELDRADQAEMDREVEGLVAVEDLAVELDRADREAVDQGVEGRVAVEDLAPEQDRADQAVVDQAVVDQAVVDQGAGGQVAEDRAEDLVEGQVVVAEPEGEAGRLEKSASGAQPQQCCATRWRGEFRERQEWVPQVQVEAAATR